MYPVDNDKFNNEVAINGGLNKKKSKLLIFSIIAVAALLVSSTVTFFILKGVLSYENIYKGVHIENVDVSEKTKQQAIDILNEMLSFNGSNIKINVMGKTENLNIEEIDLKFDILNAVDKAFEMGRQGSNMERLSLINSIKKTPINIPIGISCDEGVLQEFLNNILEDVGDTVKEIEYVVDGSKLRITKGIAGEAITVEDAEKQILNSIINSKELTVNLETKKTEPRPFDIEKIYSEIARPPKDAFYRVENYELIIVDEEVGIDFDKEEAVRIFEGSDSSVVEVPLTLKYPTITKSQVGTSFFKDELSSYTTRFNAGATNRVKNIQIASNYLNGSVVEPGGVLSYNASVGPRIRSRGYVDAPIFINGTVEDGLAGGICQLSSTLYNAALYGDFDIVERTNHSLSVSYVPLGQDATVVDGAIDFKFRNNTSNPIKVNAVVSGGTLTVSIKGTKEGPDKKVTIENVRVKTIPASETTIDDASLEVGKTVVTNGADGATIQSYKTVTQNGNVIKPRTQISTSTYSPSAKTIRVGTKPTDNVNHVEIVEPIPEDPAPEPAPQPTAPQVTNTPASNTEKPEAEPDSTRPSNENSGTPEESDNTEIVEE